MMRQRQIPRLRLTRSRKQCFSLGGCGTQRFEETHELPALRLGQLCPHGHSLSDDTVREDPENRAGLGVLNFGRAQAGSLLPAFGVVAMAFGATLSEQDSPCRNSVGAFFSRM